MGFNLGWVGMRKCLHQEVANAKLYFTTHQTDMDVSSRDGVGRAEMIIRTSRLVGYQSTSRRQCYEVC